MRCIESINTNLELNVDVVINSEYMNRENLINLFSNSRHNYTLFEDIKDIEFLMKKADFAIASFGQVAYELAACNVPCILLSPTKDHYDSSSTFDFYGIGVSTELGLKNWSKLSEIIYKFISGGYFFKNMKENLNKIPIESGCKKISDLIIEEYKKSS